MAESDQETKTPRGDASRLDRADGWTFAATSLLTVIGYLLTLSPEVTLEWSGILTTGAMYGGVGPPAGYPAWTIYSWLFIHLLPFSNPAWRVAVGSAVAGAISCGLVALMISRSGKIIFESSVKFDRLKIREQNWIRGMSGYVAGMALGFSDSFWNEALVADVMTFTVFLFIIIIFLLMRWMETGRRRLCWLAFFVYGLLLTNSQEMITALPGIACAALLIDRKLGRDLCLSALPMMLFATSFTQYVAWNFFSHALDWPLLIVFIIAMLAAVWQIVATRSFASEWKSVLACSFLLLLGFGTYLYLPIVSATNPPVNWAYSRTLEGFVHLVSRGQYEHIIPVIDPVLFVPPLWRLLIQTCREFGWPYLIFALLPFCFLLRMNRAGQKWMCALFLISICIGPLLSVLLNFPDERQSQELAQLYFYPLRVPLALWTGMGLALFATKTATLNADRLAKAESKTAPLSPQT